MKPAIPIIIALTLQATLSACNNKDEFTFENYEQILPRGQIAAITEPEYVGAEAAKIDGDSYVLGVVIEGQSRAYSLNLLNAHEVVNDKIQGQAYAAVW